MYREKLYRAKSTIENDDVWYEGSLLTTKLGQKVIRYEKNNEINHVVINEDTLAELVFRNNKGEPLFEGDFLKLGNEVEALVLWDKEKLCYTFHLKNDSDTFTQEDLKNAEKTDSIFTETGSSKFEKEWIF